MNSYLIALKKQLKDNAPTIFWITVPLILILGLGFLFTYIRGISFGYLSWDVTDQTHSRFYLGAISQLGFIIESAAATTCFFAVVLLRASNKKAPVNKFLLMSGLLVCFFCFDDMFEFHEIVFPYYIGISEHLVHVLYFLIIFSYLYCFRVDILKSDYVLLACTFILLGIHELTDLLRGRIFIGDGQWSVLIEDGSKFIGMGFWLAFSSTISYKALIAHFNLRNQ